jgi:iron complex outermembrane receptor protein
VNIIDHVDVLKEGAGAIYGSDAIAGVVNFVTKKNVNDLTINGEFGQTTHGDGPHHAISLMWGGSTDKFDFVLSGNRQKAVYAGARLKDALYPYSGLGRLVTKAGSSRVPNGRASLPFGHILPNGQGAGAFYKCSAHTNNVTRTPGTDGTALADYQCLHGSFNYQPFNLLVTPQERGALFASSTYHINDDLEAYAQILNNKTHSGFEIAPLPFDATADDVVISSANQYNPFGQDFEGLDPELQLPHPFVTLGDRFRKTHSDTKLGNFGLRGKLPCGDWRWD